ncbi:MAG: LptF/LptG family permease, partial [Paludibacteraceae bacterium]|nr:LptF/LptG family permease [Paludibacteraceae bacterium]
MSPPEVKDRIDRAIRQVNRMKMDQPFIHSAKQGDIRRAFRYDIERHRKFTLAFACLIFFFIAAPLGAIIRKGGLGFPTVISVILFLIYYIIDNSGYKMAREVVWPVWQGIWLSSFVLFPLGIFLTYMAAKDRIDTINIEPLKRICKKLVTFFRSKGGIKNRKE